MFRTEPNTDQMHAHALLENTVRSLDLAPAVTQVLLAQAADLVEETSGAAFERGLLASYPY